MVPCGRSQLARPRASRPPRRPNCPNAAARARRILAMPFSIGAKQPIRYGSRMDIDGRIPAVFVLRLNDGAVRPAAVEIDSPPPLEGGGWGEGYLPENCAFSPLPPAPSLKGRGRHHGLTSGAAGITPARVDIASPATPQRRHADAYLMVGCRVTRPPISRVGRPLTALPRCLRTQHPGGHAPTSARRTPASPSARPNRRGRSSAAARRPREWRPSPWRCSRTHT